ncbi:MAG: glycine cleavage system protein GcvH [Candidatus Latescibacteria bacterium]|nr:glycine cleavage system protein GcvH [Candidatus Latescibacterota bacterium]
MNIPEELRYTDEHEWVKLDGDIATVGITDHAQDQLGDIVFVELPSTSDSIEAQGIFGQVEAVKTVSDLFSPLTGSIVEVNEELEAHPEYVNEDAYGSGWMIKIQIDNAGAYEDLLTAKAYQDLIGEE